MTLKETILGLWEPILIVGNKSPDGDSLASGAAILAYCVENKKEAFFYLVNPAGEMEWMVTSPHFEYPQLVVRELPGFESIVVVDDCFDCERLGLPNINISPTFNPNIPVVVIDHHASNKNASDPRITYFWRDHPSTAAILAEEGFTHPLLYVGMYTDTLGFQVRPYDSLSLLGDWIRGSDLTSPQAETFNALLNPKHNTALLEAFLDAESVFMTGIFQGKTYQTVHLALDLGETKDEAKQYWPLLQTLRSYADLYSITDLSTGRTSIRSRNDNLTALMFAEKFGGGGHIQASGCNVTINGLSPLAGFRNLCSLVERKLTSPRVRTFM